MADVRLTRQGIEALSEAPDLAGVYKQSIEVLADNSSVNTGAAARLTRMGIEVIRSASAALDAFVSKQSIEAVISNAAPSNGSVQLVRQGIEVLVQHPNPTIITKQSLEAAVSNAGTNTGAIMYLTRQGVEVLSKRGPSPVVPLADPDEFFLFPHNWSDEVEMTTSYKTDISQAQSDSSEERRALLARPNRVIRFSWLQNEPEFMVQLCSTLRKVANSRLTVPLYQDQMELTAAGAASDVLPVSPELRRVTVGQRVAILKLDKLDRSRLVAYDLRRVETMTISSITVDSPTSFALDPGDTIVLPMIDTEVNLEAGLGMPVRQVGRVTLELHEVLGPSSLLPTASVLPGGQNFEGRAVWKVEHNWADDFEVRFVRDGRRISQGRGEIIDLQGARHRTIFSYRPGPMEREEFWELLRAFDAARGRCRAFWLPDPDNNYTVLASSGGGAFVDVDPLGTFEDFTAEFDYVAVILKDGTHILSAVFDLQETLGVWRITLADAQSFSASDVARICRLRKVRFESDDLVERWRTTGVVEAQVELIEVLADGEVTL